MRRMDEFKEKQEEAVKDNKMLQTELRDEEFAE